MNCQNIFLEDERIVRFIYSIVNINPNTNKLRKNFVQFLTNKETGKNELSCIRFEFETIENCRFLAKHFSNPPYNRNYYGLACVSVRGINEHENYELKHTPITTPPESLYHCDVYDNSISLIEKGAALPPEVNLERDIFLNRWKSFEDKGDSFSKELIQY